MANDQRAIMWIGSAILILILHVVAVGGGGCIAHEREALLRFKADLSDRMGRLDSWNGSDCCRWRGLECHKSNGHVVKLDLRNPRSQLFGPDFEFRRLWVLNGSINMSDLFSLRYLEYLDLSGNNFYGSRIPAQIRSLQTLRYLNMSDAEIGGSLEQLGSLALLEHLDLSGNLGLGGVLPSELGNLTRLKYLDLSLCNCSGVVPSEVGSLALLEHLDLSGNDELGGVIPSELGNLTRLKYLDLSLCHNLGGVVPPEVGRLTLLEHLDLSGNDELGGVIPSELGNLTRLKHLELSYCNFRGVIPSEVGTLFALQHLGLSSQNDLLEIHSLSWLGNLTALASLSLDGVNMSKVDDDCNEVFHRNSRLQYLSMERSSFPGLSIPSSLLNLTSLVLLDISRNNLSSMSLISQAQWPHLAYLDLGSNQIQGVIPHSIGNLTKLTDLTLGGNKLHGSLPPSLGRLFSLTWLDLSHNQVSGSMPPSLTNLSSLQHLYLRNNQLSGSNPQCFRQLSSLKGLDLSQNQLNDTLRASFSLPSTLQSFNLSFNNLQGHISFSLFQNLTALTEVDLSENHLTFNTAYLSIPAFQLEVLKLAACNIEGEFPAVISTQFKLGDLDLSRNRIRDNIPTWLWQLTWLSRVNISYNLLTGGLPPTLKTPITDLTYNHLEGPLPTSFPEGFRQLYLSHNFFNGSIPSQIGKYMQLPQLFLSPDCILDLSNNHLSGDVPSSICGNGSLQIIDLSDNNLTGIVDPNLWNCSALVKLNLANNNLNGQIPEQLGRLRQLQTLRMNGNNLSGPLPSSLQSCESLEIMDLSHNKLSGTIPTWIYHLSKLRVLILKSNAFKGRIPSEITRLHDLQVLVLSCNYLIGELPPDLTNFRAMKYRSLNTHHSFADGSITIQTSDHEFDGIYQALNIHEDEANLTNKGQEMYYVQEILYQVIGIDVSNNYLSGNIPEEMGLLHGLIFLNLSRNQFKGEIPRSFGKISELESLDLSRNRLQGEIPMELQALTFLEYLDVSHNMLTGRIPEGHQFLTFNASSFEANKDLCGPQLNKSCENKHSTKKEEEMPEENGFEISWWHVGVGLSYVFGFSAVWFVIAINRRWRRNYFEFMDRYVILLLETMNIL